MPVSSGTGLTQIEIKNNLFVEFRTKLGCISIYSYLLTIGRHCKEAWYAHVSRFSGLAKTIIAGGTVSGGSRRSRQQERWEDSVQGWSVLELSLGTP